MTKYGVRFVLICLLVANNPYLTVMGQLVGYGSSCLSSSSCGSCMVCQSHLCTCSQTCQLVGSACNALSSSNIINPGLPCGSGYSGTCGGSASCMSGMCMCPTGFILQNNICLAQSLLGGAGSYGLGGSSLGYGGYGGYYGGYPGYNYGSGSLYSGLYGGGYGYGNGYGSGYGNGYGNGYGTGYGNSYGMGGYGSLFSNPYSNYYGGLYGNPYYSSYGGGMGSGLSNGYYGNTLGTCGYGYGGFAYPGQTCGSSCYCAGGSSCVQSTCACPTGYLMQNQACIMQQTGGLLGGMGSIGSMGSMGSIGMGQPISATIFVQLGGTCSTGYPCVGGAQCVQSVCQCGTGWYQMGRSCYRKKLRRPNFNGTRKRNNGTIIPGKVFFAESFLVPPTKKNSSTTLPLSA